MAARDPIRSGELNPQIRPAESTPSAKNGEFARYQLPVILWMLVIFVSSAIPSAEFPKVDFWGWAKLIHLIYYCVLCFLLQRALRHQNRFPLLARHPLLFAVSFAALYGVSDEFHQLFTPGRHGMASDVLIDSFGAVLFIAGARAVSFFKPKRTPSP